MSKQYDQYLVQHKANVKKGFEWIKENLPQYIPTASVHAFSNPTDVAPGFSMSDIEWQINMAHDASKDKPDEYDAYDAYFYGGNRSFFVTQAFNKAWLFHIHRNPHHWQYWVLIHDDPNEPEECIEMPYNYLVEMICDWWAFSWAKGSLSEIFTWYDERKDYIKLHSSTRATLESILGQMKTKLEESPNDQN